MTTSPAETSIWPRWRSEVGSVVTWGMAHGLSRVALRRAARQGDLLARLTVEPGLRRDPYPGYEELRSRGPLVRGRIINGTVSHRVADEILRSDRFGVAGGRSELPPAVRRVLDWSADPYATSPVDPPSMLAVDPPDHTRYRRLVSRAFTARRVATMEDRVRETADRLLDGLEERAGSGGTVDLVEHYASRLPVAVIADLLGIPAAMHERLLQLGNEAAITLDPGLSWRQHRRAEAAVRELHLWFEDHVAALRRSPGDDLLSALTSSQEAERLSDLELRSVGLLLLGAGFETTVNLIGNAVVLLDRHPDQREVLRAEPSSWGGAVEEALRFESPVQLTLRSAYDDVEVGRGGGHGGGHGVELRRGDAVLLYLGGANRDPEVFDDPGRFDVTRPNAADHLALSAGVHHCLGASLARLEGRVALQALHERFPRLSVQGTPTLRGTRVLRGHDRIDARLS